jgi:two-component system, OmpR family, response regulator CpxR
MASILLADDDVELCELLAQYLKAEGFEVTAVHDGQQAIDALRKASYDLLILDVMLPQLTGFEVLRQLREQSKLPVLMLTARGEDVDRIVGLEMGADDYLSKPCNPRELVARMRAILRRTQKPVVQENEIIRLGDVMLDLGKHRLEVKDQEMLVTSTEFTILALLLRNAGTVVNKDLLSEKALGRKLTAFDRSLDMHVSNLRKKLGPYPNKKSRIKTIRGVGYQYILPG